VPVWFKSQYVSQDGTPRWGKAAIDGPGVWVSCVKGKEKQAIGELYDLFESVNSIWFKSRTIVDEVTGRCRAVARCRS
jgi:hypothetical protein